ncbi:MAG: peptide deformylase [Thermodesulfobacterium geofontis]|uniref:Peptide deformylase n=1 Tax=Thermodesulfobacterium geofontis TaxID=1295609 RepID=A0A2N7Q882_9BACT|nr:MAG: peptide deformylase [Thermodesulfobacterium geofontis]
MEILIFGHPALRERAKPVENINGKLKETIDKMAETMYKAKGIGLAANQVGILKRFFIMDVSQREGKNKLEVYINPEIVSAEGETLYEEGCLSIPGYFAPVKRYAKIYVKAYDINETLIEKELEGISAIVFQHEYDHLDGILFIDRLSHIKRQLFKKWWRKHYKK